MSEINYQITIDQQLPPLIREEIDDKYKYSISFNYSCPVSSIGGNLYIYNLTNSQEIKNIELKKENILNNKIDIDFTLNKVSSSDLTSDEETDLIAIGTYYKIQISFDTYEKHYSNFGISKCIDKNTYDTIFSVKNNQTILDYYTNDKENYLEFYKYNLINNNTGEILLNRDFYAVEEDQNQVIGNLISKEQYQQFEGLTPNDIISFKKENLLDNSFQFLSNNDLIYGNNENIITTVSESQNKKYYEYNDKLQRYLEIDPKYVASEYYIQANNPIYEADQAGNINKLDNDTQYYMFIGVERYQTIKDPTSGSYSIEREFLEDFAFDLNTEYYYNIEKQIFSIENNSTNSFYKTKYYKTGTEIKLLYKSFIMLSEEEKNIMQSFLSSFNYAELQMDQKSQSNYYIKNDRIDDFIYKPLNSNSSNSYYKKNIYYEKINVDDIFERYYTKINGSFTSATSESDSFYTEKDDYSEITLDQIVHRYYRINSYHKATGNQFNKHEQYYQKTGSGHNSYEQIELSDILKNFYINSEHTISIANAGEDNLKPNKVYYTNQEEQILSEDIVSQYYISTKQQEILDNFKQNRTYFERIIDFEQIDIKDIIHSYYERYSNSNYYQLTADDQFYGDKRFYLNKNKTFVNIFNFLNLSNTNSKLKIITDILPQKNFITSNSNGQFAWIQQYNTRSYYNILIPFQINQKADYFITYSSDSFDLKNSLAFLINSNNSSNSIKKLNNKSIGAWELRLIDDDFENGYLKYDYLWLYLGNNISLSKIKNILATLQIYQKSHLTITPPIYQTSIVFKDLPELKYSDNYTLQFFGKTHLQQEITVEKQLKKENVYKNIWFPVEIVTTNLIDEGCIDIQLKSMEDYGGFTSTEPFRGKYQLLRADKDHNYENWEVVTKFNLTTGLYNVPIYKDYSVEQGKEYLYGIEQINDYGVVSDIFKAYLPIRADFDDMFLIDDKAKIKIKFNPKVSSFKTTKQEQKQETLGSKYPYIMRNYNLGYKEIPISGLISFNMDDSKVEKFLEATQDDIKLEEARNLQRTQTWNNFQNQTDEKRQQDIIYSDTDLISDNFFKERQFKLALLDWLNNNKYKLLKTPAEGNYIVQLTNVSLSPNETLGRMLHTFTATAIEVADYNFDNLNNLVNLNKETNLNTQWLKTESQSLKLTNNNNNIELNTINNALKNSLIKINNNKIYWIGFEGASTISLDNSIKDISSIVDNSFIKLFKNIKKTITQIKSLVNNNINDTIENLKIVVQFPFICKNLTFEGLPENTKITFQYRDETEEHKKLQNYLRALEDYSGNYNFYKKIIILSLIASQNNNSITYIDNNKSLNVKNAQNISGFILDFSEINNSNLNIAFLDSAQFSYSYMEEITADSSFSKIQSITRNDQTELCTVIGERQWTNTYWVDTALQKNRIRLIENNLNKDFYYQLINHNDISIPRILQSTYGKVIYSKNQYIKNIYETGVLKKQIQRCNSFLTDDKICFISQIKIYEKSKETIYDEQLNLTDLNIYNGQPLLPSYITKDTPSNFKKNSNVLFDYENNSIKYLVYIDNSNTIRCINKPENWPEIQKFYIATADALYNDNLEYINQLCSLPKGQNFIEFSNLDNLEFFWLGAGLYAEISYQALEIV